MSAKRILIHVIKLVIILLAPTCTCQCREGFTLDNNAVDCNGMLNGICTESYDKELRPCDAQL